MSQQHPWGAPRHHQTARLPPISTAFAEAAQAQRNTPSPSAAYSPAAASFPALPASSARRVGSRKSSAASSTSAPFSPAGQQPAVAQLLSARNRTIAPQTASHLASSAAATQQTGGGTSSSGGGANKLARSSPSLSASSTLGSPSNAINSTASSSSQSLSRIVIAQVFLLLSQLGPLKDDKDRAKWELQSEQIRKLIDSNGMEVFTKYFRRLLNQNASHVFSSSGRPTDAGGSYQQLVTEVQKLRKEPEQASKIAESLDTNEQDVFRDFDLAAFVAHFQLDPVAKTLLALACRMANKADLRTKADAILANSSEEFLMAVARPSAAQADDLPLTFAVALLERLLGDPPPNWNEEKRLQLSYAMHMRYQNLQLPLPAEIEAALQLSELTDGAQNPLVKFVQQAGPKATTTVDACKEMLASVETRDISYQQVASVLLFMAILQSGQKYNAKNFVAALREHRNGQRLDWQDVVHSFDRETLRLAKPQFLTIYNALLPVAQESENFDIQLLWGGTWQHEITQLAFLMCFLSCTAEELDVTKIPRLRAAFTMKLFEQASEETKAVAERAAKHPYVSLDATTALFGMIFRSSESYNSAQMLGIPDAIINPHTAEFLVSAVAVPKPWGALHEQALKQLFEPYFFKRLRDYDFVIYGLWQQDAQWLVDRFVDSYNTDLTSLTLILEHAQAHGFLEPLIRLNTDISLDLAAQAHARDLFEIEPWLHETLEQAGHLFKKILLNFLGTRASDEMQSLRDDHPPSALPLAVKTVSQLLWFLAECGLQETEILPLQRTCIQAYPRLINYGEGVDEIIDANSKNGNRLPDEADKKMQEHFKKMYGGESDVRDIINILKKYKESQDPTEQDLFACMIHGLFDEYNCFGEYPLEALATTAVLFGGIINYNLLSRIALQVGLAMVLEAVQEYRTEDSMYKFGLQALIHFKDRLAEWPNYCDQLLTVHGLQHTEVFPIAEEVVGQQIDNMNGDAQNGIGLTNGASMDDLIQPSESAVPKFKCLHVDPPMHADLYEDPDEEVQDRVLFVLNNVSERNLNEKIRDLMSAVEARHHQWFASYLVEERAKMQPNFQQLYLDMLNLFNDRQLWAEVLRETYVAVIRILQSDTTLGATERGHLKNLGTWLGSLTIARDQPIKFRNISFKDLLTEAYDTDRLPLVIPFTCKVLTQAAQSVVFRPPNPWLMEIIRVLMELYHCADLKLNQKFAIELLATDLNLDYKELEPSNSIMTRPPPEEEFMGSVAPDGIEPFSDLSIMSLNRGRGPNERFSSAAITAALPDFTNQLIYPPNGNSVVPSNTLKKIFLTAVQQAIQEIIAPVVERSVTIAAISTSQLVNKDFAMEPDEEKLRTAAHTVVKSLSGALALVTCKEPLRMSIMNNIRLMARDLPEQALPEGHVLMFVNDNLDLVCNTVEQAAEISSMAEIDMQIEDSVRVRRLFRDTRPNETFKDANTSAWAFYIPEPYKQTSGGLNREQLAIYEDFGRQSRGATQSNNASQDNARQLPDVLQDQYAAVPNITTPAGAPAEPRQGIQQPRLQSLPSTQAPQGQQQLNGYMDPAVQDRPQRTVEELLLDLMRNIKEAPEERLNDLQPTSPIYETFDQLVQAIETSPANKDQWAYRIAGQVTNHLFSEQLRRLEVEVLTRLLGNLCSMSVQTSRQVLIWLATMHDDDRIFNATVMSCLMDVGLMDMHRLNTIIAKALAQRRLAAVEMLASLMDEVLLNEHPSALRADFALSIDALTTWLTEEPGLEAGKQLIAKLQISPAEQSLTPPATGHKDQLEYIFDEWVQLLMPDTPKKTFAAFIYQLHENNVMKGQSDSIEFIRTCIDASAAAYEREEFALYGGNPDVATIKVDALAKLIVCLVVYQGEQDGSVQESKAKYMDGILTVVILAICNQQKARPDRFNPKVFFRLFSSMLFELNSAVKDNAFADCKDEVFLAVARVFLALQPRNFPLLTFSWLALVSHRIFVPAMLEDDMQENDGKEKRWDAYAQLMEILLSFTGQLIKPTGETIISQNFYRGVLRVLLVIHHDYPEFLAENHFRFCNSIPMHCTQLRNLIVSAYPSVILEMPDPFSAGLKVDRIEDVRQAPVIRADIDTVLTKAGIKDVLDNLLSAADMEADAIQSVCEATYFAEPKPAGFELVPTSTDPIVMHAIVIYIGTMALNAPGSKGPSLNPSSPAAKLLEALVKTLRPEARFHFISAIANQLRWPNAHTHFFSHGLLHLFGPPNTDPQAMDVQQVITRVLLERLLVHRPHPWGLIITLLEILKNRTYAFWELPFVKAAPEVERLLNALFTHAQQSPRPLA